MVNESEKLIKSLKRTIIELLIIVPTTLSLLVVFGIYEKVMNETIFYYSFWSGVILAFILGMWNNYDIENKI